MNNASVAHGKVILLGEHSVVYGHPALVTGIAKGARAWAHRTPQTTVLRLCDHEVYPGEGEVGAAFAALLHELGSPSIEVDAELTLPAGVGLGASAALGVAIARSILHATGKDTDAEDATRKREILAADAWERQFHGTPSGIDVAAASLGGCIHFTRSEGARALPVGAALSLAVGLVGPKVSTKTMVLGLAELRSRSPGAVDEIMMSIRALVDEATSAIARGDLISLGQLMNENQRRLRELELSTERLDFACRVANENGALGAKLTGKGGGGCAIALCREDPSAVLAAWSRHNITGFSTSVPQQL